MSSSTSSAAKTQADYYAKTAHQYNDLHVQDPGEHELALAFLCGAIEHFQITSILDVGSGTGRALAYLASKCPNVKIVGVEPIKELREIGYSNGISRDSLIEGDALNLKFADGAFDLVCEFGILHHIKVPHIAVSEMLRVAKKGIFISDNNNFGQGSFTSRTIKQFLNYVGLWKIADLIRTKGKGYMISEGDGLFYSYSVFNNYKQIEKQCKSIHLLNTKSGHINPYKTATHVGLLGIKK